MSDFLSGVILSAIVFGLPRLMFGRFTIWEYGRGWVLRFETRDQRDEAIYQLGMNYGIKITAKEPAQ